jgi:hypothetical protein
VHSLSVTLTFDGAPISRTAKVADSSLLNVHHVAFLQFSYLGYRRVGAAGVWPFPIQFRDQMGVSVSNQVIQPVWKSVSPLLHETETDHGKANSVERG